MKESVVCRQTLGLMPFAASPFTLDVTWSAKYEGSRPLLEVQFVVAGPLDKLVWPDRSVPGRRGHELWKSTCFEVFIHRPDATRYLEWNVSPAGEWDVHRFHSYRQPDAQPIGTTPLQPLDIDSGKEDGLWITYRLSLDDIQESLGPPPWLWQPTAVLATTSGEISYWAPAHPAAQADFHITDHLSAWNPYSGLLD